MVELDKKRMKSLLENSLNPTYSIERSAQKIGVSHDCLHRVLQEKEIGLTNFLKIIYWLKQEKLLSFDQILHLLLKEEE